MNPQTAPAVAPAQGYPRKLFYRIGEVADIVGVKPYVLRYWETEFPELCPEKDGSDQRRYRPGDVRTALAIRKLLYEDRFTIKGARGRLRDAIRSAETGEPMPSGPRSDDADTGPETGQGAPCAKIVTVTPAGDPAVLKRELGSLKSDVTELMALLDS